MCRSRHNWGEPERTTLREWFVYTYIIWYIAHIPYMCYSLIYRIANLHSCITQLSNLACCMKSLARDNTSCIHCCKLSSIEEQNTATAMNSEPVLNKRELRLQRRRERDRAHCQSELAEQRKEWLRRRRIRNRARHAAQTVEQRQLCLQQRLAPNRHCVTLVHNCE